MRKRIAYLAIFAAGLMATASGWSSPLLLYRFSTTAFRTDCVTQTCIGATYRSSLDRMYVVLDGSVFPDGTAWLRLFQNGPTPVAIQNEGVAAIALARFPGDPVPIALDASAYPVNDPSRYWDLDVQFAVGDRLAGQLYINDGSSELSMAMGPEGVWYSSDPARLFNPASASEWTGFVRSDALNTEQIFFTGEWRFSRTVPEPSSGGLLLVAAVSLLWLQCRQRRGKRMAQRWCRTDFAGWGDAVRWCKKSR